MWDLLKSEAASEVNRQKGTRTGKNLTSQKWEWAKVRLDNNKNWQKKEQLIKNDSGC